MNLAFEPQTLDWVLAQDSYSFDIVANLMLGLTRFSMEEGKLVSKPACASSWEINDDATEYIFHLNPAAKWTDGVPVTAQHFIDSLEYFLDPKTAAPYTELFEMLDLSQSMALDDLTLKIKLKHPAAYFIFLTSYRFLLPIRRELIERYGDRWTDPENIITNGPFKLKEWQHEYKIVLERNPDYFLDIADSNIRYLKFFMVAEQTSAYTLFQNGQFDWVDGRSIPSSEMRNIEKYFANTSDSTKIQAKRVPLLRNTFVGFNTEKEPFDNPKLRQAFAYAIDREALTSVIARGYVANATWIPPSLSFFHDTEKDLAYKPDLARKLLAETGYTPQNLPKLEFFFPSTEENKLLAETLQSFWKKELGIEVELFSMDWKVFLDNLKRNTPHIFRLNWTADYPDPDTFMQLFTSDNAINYGKWHNLEYDRLVKQAAASINQSDRRKLYNRAEEILTEEEMAITPIFVNTQNILFRGVENLEANPLDIFFLEKVRKI